MAGIFDAFMNALHIFYAEWWPVFLGVSLTVCSIWFVGRFDTHSYFLFTSPKAFRELATFAEDEQRRLLQEASKETFRCWWSVLPVIAFALVLSGGIALGRTVPKVTHLPDKLWVHVVFAVLLTVVGGWFVVRLAVSCVRPFLKRLIERTSHAA
jgi:hypothetical protein